MSIETVLAQNKLRQERHGAVHAPPHMPLLTELDAFVVGVVAIDMSLLAELDDPWPLASRKVPPHTPLLTGLDGFAWGYSLLADPSQLSEN